MASTPQSSKLGLQPFQGKWSLTLTRHLLNRTLFGATSTEINYFNNLGLTNSVNEILSIAGSLPSLPLNDYNSSTVIDTGSNLGTTWINSINTDGTINSNRRTNYKKWLFSVLVNQEKNIREKMTFFWSNHFGTEADTIVYGTMLYQHHQLFRTNPIGNFKQIVKNVTIDPGMLKYLNGYLNTKTAPDENYGRELQELFTIGKDGGAKYSEEDVKAAARVLTGWRYDSNNVAYFDSTRHDTTNKVFSSFYNNKIITGKTGTNGAQELDELLDLLFSKTETAKFICRKLYKYFVYYYIDDFVENNIIRPLASTLIASGFEIKPVLKQLFESEHFYDTVYLGCQIKSPLDFIIGFLRSFQINFPNAVTDFADAYFLYNQMVNQAISMGQNPVDPPNVAGWPAYYQAPEYNELWVNADTFPKRNKFTDLMLETGYTKNGKKIIINPINFVKAVSSNPSNPDSVINDIVFVLLATELSSAIKASLKTQILLSGQSSDYYWTDAWNLSLSAPTTINLNIINTRLKNLIKYIMNLPEYQLQ
jgi:uncharacterized protein (DUF1800 family)